MPHDIAAAVTGNDQAWTEDGLPHGRYVYRVKANTSSGDGEWSNFVRVTIPTGATMPLGPHPDHHLLTAETRSVLTSPGTARVHTLEVELNW